MKFFDYYNKNKIILVTYLPYSTHSLQPLDVRIFSPLSKAYSNKLEVFLYISLGLSYIIKQDFFHLFFLAWGRALTCENIISSWKTIRIHPFNLEIILKKFSKELELRPSTSESSHSILSVED
jgi:hypothetical protein